MDIAHSALHRQAHISPPKHMDTRAHARSVSHQKREKKKSQPIIIKYLWHIVNGFVKKIASY